MPLINPISFRLGINRYWENKRSWGKYAGYEYRNENWLLEVIRSAFDNYWEPKYGLVYSHCLVKQYPKKVDLVVYVHDQHLDAKIEELVNHLCSTENYSRFYAAFRKKLPPNVLLPAPARTDTLPTIYPARFNEVIDYFFNTPKLMKKRAEFFKKRPSNIELNRNTDFPTCYENEPMFQKLSNKELRILEKHEDELF